MGGAHQHGRRKGNHPQRVVPGFPRGRRRQAGAQPPPQQWGRGGGKGGSQYPPPGKGAKGGGKGGGPPQGGGKGKGGKGGGKGFKATEVEVLDEDEFETVHIVVSPAPGDHNPEPRYMKRVDREAVNSEIKIQAGRAGISKEMLTGYEGQRVKGTLNNFTIPMPDRVSAEKKKRAHRGIPRKGGPQEKEPPAPLNRRRRRPSCRSARGRSP